MPSTRSAVREWLGRTDGTQRSFAERLGISEAHLSMILSGEKTPSLRLAVKMSRISGIPIEQFCPPEQEQVA